MVDFNKPIPPANDPSYIRYSQGYSEAKPNKAMESLFSGIGEIATGAVNVADLWVKDKVIAASKDAEGFRNVINDPAVEQLPGKPQATDVSPAIDAGGALPGGLQPKQPNMPEVPGVLGQMASMKEAVKQGTMDNTYYAANVEALARQLRAKYPGYRDFIDAQIQKTTGIDSANALRVARMNDMTTATSQADALAKEERTLVNSNADVIGLTTYHRDKAEGRPWSMQQIQAAIAEVRSQEAQANHEKTRLGLEAQNGAVAASRVEESATKTFSVITDKMYKASTEAGGLAGTIKRINEIQEGISKGGQGASPEEQVKISAALNGGLQAMETAMRAEAHKPINSDGDSIASLLNKGGGGPEKLQKLIDQALMPHKMLVDAVNNKEYGHFTVLTRLNAANKNADTAKLMEDPLMRAASAVRDLFGDAGLTHMLTTSSEALKGMPESYKGVIQHFINQAATNTNSRRPGAPAPTLGEAAKAAFESGIKAPQFYNGLIDSAVTVLKDPKTPSAAKANMVRSLFSPENNVLFQSMPLMEHKMKAFMRLTSPEVSKAMESAPPAQYEMYKQFVTDKASFFINRTAQDLQSEVTAPSSSYELTWNPESAQLAVKYIGPKGTTYSPDSSTFGANFANRMQTKVNDLNRMLTILKPIAGKEGANMSEEMLNLVKIFGVDPSAGKDKTVIEKIGNAISKTFTRKPGEVPRDTSIFKDITGNPTEPGGTPAGVSQYAPTNLDGNGRGISLSPVAAARGIQQAIASNPTGDHMEIATSYLGLNRSNGGEVIREFFKDASGKNLSENVPYCAAFANSILQNSGRPGTGSLAARSFLSYGKPTDTPKRGDVVVFSRGSNQAQGHVGFFDSMNPDGTMNVLGGNQGRGEVTISKRSTEGLLGIRRPPSPAELKEFGREHGLEDRPAPGVTPKEGEYPPNTPDGFYIPPGDSLDKKLQSEFYGTPFQGVFTEGGKIQSTNSTADELTTGRTINEAQVSALSDIEKEQLAQHLRTINQSPLATLGFSLKNFFKTNENDRPMIAHGMTAAEDSKNHNMKKGDIFSPLTTSEDTPFHESLHNGIMKLKEYPEGKTLIAEAGDSVVKFMKEELKKYPEVKQNRLQQILNTEHMLIFATSFMNSRRTPEQLLDPSGAPRSIFERIATQWLQKDGQKFVDKLEKLALEKTPTPIKKAR